MKKTVDYEDATFSLAFGLIILSPFIYKAISTCFSNSNGPNFFSFYQKAPDEQGILKAQPNKRYDEESFELKEFN